MESESEGFMEWKRVRMPSMVIMVALKIPIRRLKFGFDSNRLARRPDRWPSPIKSVQSQSNVQ